MNTSTNAILVLFGGMLVYLAIFGLAVPGLFALTTGFSDNFNDGTIDTSRWALPDDGGTGSSIGSYIDWPEEHVIDSTNGELWCTGVTSPASYQGLITKDSYDFRNGGSVSINWHDVQTGAIMIFCVADNTGLSGPEWQHHSIRFQRDSSGLKSMIVVPDSTGKGTISRNDLVNTAVPSGNLKIEFTTTQVKMYYGPEHQPSSTPSKTYALSDIAGIDLNNLYVEVWSCLTGQVAFDDFSLSGGGSGTTGRLRFKAYSTAGGLVVGHVTCTTAPSGVTISTFDTSTSDWKDLGNFAVGNYKFECTINGVTASDSPKEFALDSNGKDVEFHVTGGTPSPNGTDILAKIKAFIESETGKTLELLGGAGFMGIGLIGLIFRPKSAPAYYPRQPY